MDVKICTGGRGWFLPLENITDMIFMINRNTRENANILRILLGLNRAKLSDDIVHLQCVKLINSNTKYLKVNNIKHYLG